MNHDAQLVSLIQTASQIPSITSSYNVQTPEIISSVGGMLRDAGGVDPAIEILSKSLLLHPAHFWLNCELASCYQAQADREEAINFARAAYVVSPKSSAVQRLLSAYLKTPDRADEARTMQQNTLPRRTLAGNR